jgi:hypothetical protein
MAAAESQPVAISLPAAPPSGPVPWVPPAASEGESSPRRRAPRGHRTLHVCPHAGCGREFLHKGKLNRHLVSHTGERRFACTFPGCDKRFFRVQHLQVHMFTHTGRARKFPCVEPGCGLSFNTAAHLNRHAERHANPLPLQCAHCSERFAHKRKLRVHARRVHGVGEQPFRCPEKGCATRFGTRSDLSRHMKNTHLLMRHSCLVCQQTFPRFIDLRRHSSVAHQGPHCCAVCGKSFANSHSLARHVRRQHPALVCACGAVLASEAEADLHACPQPLTCDMPGCGKQLRSSFALTRHRAAHESSGRSLLAHLVSLGADDEAAAEGAAAAAAAGAAREDEKGETKRERRADEVVVAVAAATVVASASRDTAYAVGAKRPRGEEVEEEEEEGEGPASAAGAAKAARVE